MFWENYVKLCNNMGKSPNAVAAEIGIASGSITNWKRGKTPQGRLLIKIADYFGVSVKELLKDEELSDSPILDEFTYAAHNYFGRLTAADKATVLKMMATLAAANDGGGTDGSTDGDLQ